MTDRRSLRARQADETAARFYQEQARRRAERVTRTASSSQRGDAVNRRKNGFRHAAALRNSQRERGRGLGFDDHYLGDLAGDPQALDWLAKHRPNDYERVTAKLLVERGVRPT